MTKQQLVNAIADQAGVSKTTALNLVNSFVSVVTDALSDGDKVSITGFGTFFPRLQKATTRTIPSTGKRQSFPEKVVPKFKAGKNLKEQVAECDKSKLK